MSTSPFHRTQTLALKGGTFAAVCSCGWVSSDFPEKDNCQKAANLHKVQGMRQNERKASEQTGAAKA